MNTYYVTIEASPDDGRIWQALLPLERVADWGGEAQELADWVAGIQNIAEDGHWRVRVYLDEDERELAAEYEHSDGQGQ